MTGPRSRQSGRHAGTLADPDVLAARIAALDAPPMRPLRGFVEDLRRVHGAVPDFDPFDGGLGAKLLLLLESPGPSRDPFRFVSRDNPTGTGANLRGYLSAAGIARADTILWNAVPWIIHAPGAVNRCPNRAEIASGLAALPGLLDLLPRLAAVVLAGRAAARAEDVLERRRPGLPVLTMPHPSPTIVCTSPAVATRIAAVLADAASVLAEERR